MPQEAYGPLLFIETPRPLFPFARAVVANATREAGFPPLNIAPVDFVALYRQQLEANGGKVPGIAGGPVEARPELGAFTSAAGRRPALPSGLKPAAAR